MQPDLISSRADAYGMTGDNQSPFLIVAIPRLGALSKMVEKVRERRTRIQTNEGLSGGKAGT